MSRASYGAIVIGAGVIGSSVAYALARSGLDVCVLDKGGSVGAGSTSSSSAIVRFNYSTWEGVATSWESYHAWQDWAGHLGGVDEVGMAQFYETGGVVLDSPAQDVDQVLALFDRAGIAFQRWDSATLREKMPYVSSGRFYPPKAMTDPAFGDDPDGELGGVWVSECGFVDDPALAAHNLAAAARRHGAEFRFHSAVTAIDRSPDRVAGVSLASGESIMAPVVVNVAGPWSHSMNERAGVLDDFVIDTRPLRQEVHQVRLPPDLGAPTPLPLIADVDLGVYMRGTPSGELLIGGAEPECDPLVYLDDAEEYYAQPTSNVFEAQVMRAARRIPALNIPNAPRGIVGIYDVSDDWIPIYDKTALAGYFVAIGTSGNQFKNAPIVGDLIAALIEAERSGHDHDVDPVRLRLPRTGSDIDLSHYSRRRHINRDSSFSVMG